MDSIQIQREACDKRNAGKQTLFHL